MGDVFESACVSDHLELSILTNPCALDQPRSFWIISPYGVNVLVIHAPIDS
jgi:hypothetical protein